MKHIFTACFGVALLFAASASGDTITGSAGAGWRTWTAANEDGTPYWDQSSWDRAFANIGYCLSGTGSCGMPGYPGAIPYWGAAKGSFDTSFYWTDGGSPQSAALRIELAGLSGSNEFGWYDTSAPDVLRTIFTGPDGAGAVAAFAPSQSYGFYLKSQGNVFRTQSELGSDAGWQHFAVFREPAGGAYWVGIEDLLSGNTDRDYNDMVVRIQAAPEPGTFILVGLLLVAAGTIRRLRRRMLRRRALARFTA